MPERNLFGRRRNCLIYLEIAEMREVCKIRVPWCYCQPASTLLISSHTSRRVRVPVCVTGSRTEDELN
jgi:hypothetical protein